MKKGIIITSLLALAIATTGLNAAEFDLKANMEKLDADLGSLQRGFMTSNKKAVEVALDRLINDADALFNNREQIIAMFPKDMKNKKHKTTIAMKAARTMHLNIQKIQAELANEDASMLSRKRNAQEAYQKILGACFECHNLARDK